METCRRCDQVFDPLYHNAGECKVKHDVCDDPDVERTFGGRGSDEYEYIYRCSVCDKTGKTDENGRGDGVSGFCFVGLHKARKNDGCGKPPLFPGQRTLSGALRCNFLVYSSAHLLIGSSLSPLAHLMIAAARYTDNCAPPPRRMSWRKQHQKAEERRGGCCCCRRRWRREPCGR